MSGVGESENTTESPGQGRGRSLRETGAAKEAKRRFDCGGNRLGCPSGAERGLQCGLSGNRVPRVGDGAARPSKGNHLTGNGRRAAGKANPTKAVGLPCFAAAVLASKKRTTSSFLREFRCASRTPMAHGRFAQSVFSDAHVVRKNDQIHFAPAGAKKEQP